MYITLICKVMEKVEMKDFRPKSLVSSIYKLLYKILALRIKEIMGDIVGPFQNSFMESRKILDALLIIN